MIYEHGMFIIMIDMMIKQESLLAANWLIERLHVMIYGMCFLNVWVWTTLLNIAHSLSLCRFNWRDQVFWRHKTAFHNEYEMDFKEQAE